MVPSGFHVLKRRPYCLITIRCTPEQKARYLVAAGQGWLSDWIKAKLDPHVFPEGSDYYWPEPSPKRTNSDIGIHAEPQREVEHAQNQQETEESAQIGGPSRDSSREIDLADLLSAFETESGDGSSQNGDSAGA